LDEGNSEVPREDYTKIAEQLKREEQETKKSLSGMTGTPKQTEKK
jgi:hypothetical protein